MTEEQFKKSTKTVTVFRAQSFLGQAQAGLDDYYALSNKDIGSFWDSKGMSKIGSGIDWREIEVLLPLVLDVEATDRDFKAKVKEFYCDIVTKVPHREGATFNIGLEDNSKPLSKDNLPLVPMDYIRWKHALRHPWVASSRDESTGNQLKSFYVHDPEAIRTATVNTREQKEKAMEAYLILTKEKDERIDDILAVLKQDPRGFRSKDDKLDYLESLVNSTSAEIVKGFLDVATDKKIPLKGLLAKLVHTGVLKMIGARYLITETDAIFADGEEEAILELADTEKNSQLITVLKSQLQEKMRAKIQRPIANKK